MCQARTPPATRRLAHPLGPVKLRPKMAAELHPRVLAVLGCPAQRYTLGSLRYDLAKLRAKGLVAKLPNSRRYRLLPQGYSICLIFLKLFERVYAPLTAGFPTAERLEALMIDHEDAARRLAVLIAERSDIDAARTAMYGVGPRVAGFLRDLLGLDDFDDLRLARVGL